ncbi:MAG: cysteine desulfurase family protein [Deltaproteobacteria bacterium]|nr:cysteine desulfurase family protein [Deltaproteobacteria bacterium]
MSPIYLDHNATTPLHPQVREAVVRALDLWGNPSSTHVAGRAARAAVELARRQVSQLWTCDVDETVFVSGGTEGNNLALRGLARLALKRHGTPGHIVTSLIEHPSVLGAVDELESTGWTVTRLPVAAQGAIAPDALAAALRPDTRIVSLALANHELGNVYPVAEFAAIARAAGVLIHADLVQAAGKLSLDVKALNLDAATITAHKLYGPKAIGAVYIRQGLDLAPLIAGGHQEHERRPGTENVPAIVGFGVACEIARESMVSDAQRISQRRDHLETLLLQIPNSRRHGFETARVPGTCNVGFSGARGDRVVIALDVEGVCVSAGAACTSGSLEPSPVIRALCDAEGRAPSEARNAVRFSVGRGTSDADIEHAAQLTSIVVARVRA